MNTAGTAVAVSVETVDSTSPTGRVVSSSRFPVIFAALLDSISFALFYLPFSSVSDLIGGMWCSMLAKH
jgi:hypothetical protein